MSSFLLENFLKPSTGNETYGGMRHIENSSPTINRCKNNASGEVEGTHYNNLIETKLCKTQIPVSLGSNYTIM